VNTADNLQCVVGYFVNDAGLFLAVDMKCDKVVELRLFDGQWMNIVNHAHCWEGYTKEEAIHAVVKMVEEKMAKNIVDDKWPLRRDDA
jgi:hypothetical protein